MTDTANETPTAESERKSENPGEDGTQAPGQAPDVADTTESAPAGADAAAEIASLKDRLLRLMAEMENLRKRSDRERQDATKYAVSGFARDLLSVPDNLRRTLDNLPAGTGDDNPLQVFREGLEMTERELLQAFEKAGIQKVDPLGEKFDHNYHEAMFEVPTADQPSGVVVQVIQPGYTLNGRLLRPARVGVTRAPESDNPDQPRVDTQA